MAYGDLKKLFDDAVVAHGDLMEPWVIALGEMTGRDEAEKLMRAALAATVQQRYPLPKAAA